MHTAIDINNNQKNLFDILNYKNESNTNNPISSFTEIIQRELGISPIINELEFKYDVTVTVASFSKVNDGSTFGLNGLRNVVISPKILKQMESNPKLKERIFNDVEKLVDPIWDMETKAYLRMAGLEERNRGIIVHDDAAVSWFGNAEPTAEEKERIKQLKKTKENIKNAMNLLLSENPCEVKYIDKSNSLESNSFLISIIGSIYIQNRNKLTNKH